MPSRDHAGLFPGADHQQMLLDAIGYPTAAPCATSLSSVLSLVTRPARVDVLERGEEGTTTRRFSPRAMCDCASVHRLS